MEMTNRIIARLDQLASEDPTSTISPLAPSFCYRVATTTGKARQRAWGLIGGLVGDSIFRGAAWPTSYAIPIGNERAPGLPPGAARAWAISATGVLTQPRTSPSPTGGSVVKMETHRPPQKPSSCAAQSTAAIAGPTARVRRSSSPTNTPTNSAISWCTCGTPSSIGRVALVVRVKVVTAVMAVEVSVITVVVTTLAPVVAHRKRVGADSLVRRAVWGIEISQVVYCTVVTCG